MPPGNGQWQPSDAVRAGHRALLVSADSSRAEHLVPILVQSGLEVHQVAHLTQAEQMVRSRRFRLVVLVAPVPSVGRLLQTVRGRGSSCRNAGVILVGSSQELARVERLQVRPNHTVRFDRLRVEGRLRVNDLLNVAPRAGVQAWIRLRWRLAGASQRDLAETANLSTTGMLIRGCGLIPVGTEVDFELVSAADEPPVVGRAEVVRHAARGPMAVTAMALRILRLEDDGRARLARLVARGRPAADDGSTADAQAADDPAAADGEADSRQPARTPPLVWVRPGASLHRAVESIYDDATKDKSTEDS